MSASGYWRPPPQDRNSLPKPVTLHLEKRYLAGGERITLTQSDVPYLEGLRDAGVEGATEMLKALEEHDAIEFWVER